MFRQIRLALALIVGFAVLAAASAEAQTEIGAHLGEVLWAMGRQDEARKVWRQAQARDGANEVLRETLARLQVGL